MNTRVSRFIPIGLCGAVSAVMGLALPGCASAPASLQHGGVSLALPVDFEDATQALVDQAGASPRLTALMASQGMAVEPLLAFQSAQDAHHSGGCSVNRTRLHPAASAWPQDLRQLTQALSNVQARELQHPKPWEQLHRGRTLHMNPWLAAQSVTVVSSTPTTLAGLPAWQHTLRMHWETQPGPVQPVSMARLILADLRSPASAGQTDRLLLQVTCGAVDLPGYIDTAMGDLDRIITTLRWAPGTTP